MAKLRQIAFYGKGGIGKSTTSRRTPSRPWPRWARRSSSSAATPSRLDPPDPAREGAGHHPLARGRGGSVEDLELEDVMKIGYRDIRCVEPSAPEPGVGCAGRGVITSINFLEENRCL